MPPTGSISYINNSTSSIHPIASKIEIRKEGKLGRVYYPAPFMTNDNLEYYQDAYEIGYEKVIDTYAAATQHVDQGLSLTLFFKDTATTRDINKAQIYAWRKGIKTIYYIRLRQMALEGTEWLSASPACFRPPLDQAQEREKMKMTPEQAQAAVATSRRSTGTASRTTRTSRSGTASSTTSGCPRRCRCPTTSSRGTR